VKSREEYQEEFDEVVRQLQQLDTQAQQLRTRAIELQGVLKEMGDEKTGA